MALGSPQWMYKSGEAYEIEQSLKHDYTRQSYLTWTPASSGNRKTWTLSLWAKRAKVTGQGASSNQPSYLFGAHSGTSWYHSPLQWRAEGYIEYTDYQGVVGADSNGGGVRTTAAFRDPSAWYHVMLVYDTPQGTKENRLKIYVNGVQQALGIAEGSSTNWGDSGYPLQNEDGTPNTAGKLHYLGASRDDNPGDGYLAEVNFIDGTAKTPADFGETGDYGEWKPKEYSGSYGTNGFYLPFKQDYSVEGFSTVTYKGTGVNPTYIGGTGYRPDLTWIKPRSTADNHVLYDSVRGYNKQLKVNATDAEDDNSRVASATDGFTLTTTDGNQNSASHTYVAWNWDMGSDTPTGFGAVTYKGNGGTQDLSLGFEPDLVWIKKRGASEYHVMFDTVRGLGDGKALYPNADKNEGLYPNGNVSKTNSDGFTIATGSTGINYVNQSSQDYVGWGWDMGNTTATNTTGTITSTVRANPTYGQSIISWTGTGATGTVGTGLTSDAEVVIVKNRDTTDNWSYSDTIQGGGTVRGGYLNSSAVINDTGWSSRVDPSASTSNTIGVYNWDDGNKSGSNMIAYAFHSVSGYSKFGTYTGNASTTGPSVTTGFRPAFLMVKKSSDTGNWLIVDATRNPLGLTTLRINADSPNAEDSSADNNVEFTNTGFQIKTSSGGWNASGQSFIYMAFAGGMDSISNYNDTGSLDSRVKANPTYGQSIVSYTGNGASSATIGHGLSSAPEMMIVRSRGANAWAVYHTSIGNTHLLELNTTAAKADNNTFWNDTSPTNSVFTIGSHGEVNANNTGFIAYCWHSVSGYSKFGSYSGTGGSHTLSFGFRPAFILIKKSSAAGSGWMMLDTTRSPVILDKYIEANSNGAEGTAVHGTVTDTGFNITGTFGALNTSGVTYIYAAFADKREYAYWLDQSGNNNDWTSNNLTESDISVDSPTNNFATLNPLVNVPNIQYQEGNLKSSNTAADEHKAVYGTMAMSSGKWYWEACAYSGVKLTMALTDTNNVDTQQVATTNFIPGYQSPTYADGDAVSVYYDALRKNGSVVTNNIFPDNISSGEIISMAFDADTGKVWFARNGVWTNGSAASSTTLNASYPDTTVSTTANSYTPAWATEASAWVVNFGQDSSFASNKTAQGNQDGNDIGDFYYTPPSGFLALCTKNLPDVAVTPSENFSTIIWTGASDANLSLTGVGFQPDWVWIKKRTGAESSFLWDSVRGAGKHMQTDNNNAEVANYSYGHLESFDADGFTTHHGGDQNTFGYPNNGWVAWNWKAGNATLGTGDFTQGSIASTCSRNVDAGFSIINYQGNQTAGATVGHGLSKAPEMLIIKNRDTSGYGWLVGHNSLTNWTYSLVLGTTAATWSENPIWNSTAPSSTVFSLGSDTFGNKTGDDHICYAFHSVDGYSKVGSYTGNGNADGTFVYTGFRPAYVMIKPSSRTGHWMIANNKSSPSNVVDKVIFANSNAGEYTDPSADCKKDFFSNGFKIRTTDDNTNESGATYVYLAFAETPFKYSNAR